MDLKTHGNPVDEMKLRVYSKGAKEALDRYVSNTANDMERYAKSNHPWTNRTGNAERGLHTDIIKSGAGWSQTIHLAHGSDVWYGYYLENSMGKRFAIIEPTIRVFLSKASHELSSIFSDIHV